MTKQIRKLGILLCALLVAQSFTLGLAEAKQGNVKKRIARAIETLRAAETTGSDTQSAFDTFVARAAKDGEKAVPYLIEALGDQNEAAWLVRHGAITALAKIGQPAVPALIAKLRTPNLHISAGAADALALIGGSNVVEAASALLRGSNLLERKRAVYVLGHLDDSAPQDRIVQLIERRVSSLVALLRDERLHSEAELALIRMNKRGDSLVEGIIITQLIDVLRKARYSDPLSVMAGFGAAKVLGEIGEVALPALTALMEEASCSPYSDESFNDGSLGDASACGCCTLYATAFTGEPGIAALVKNVTNFASDRRTKDIRGMSMQALSDIGAASVRPVIDMLEGRYSTTNPKLATKVGLTILGSIADPNSEGVIAAYLNQEADPGLRSLSRWALDKTKARNGLTAQSANSVVSDEVSPRSLRELVEALREAENKGDDTAAPFTSLVAKAKTEGVRAFPDLFTVLSDTGQRNWVVRMAAISSFVAIGDSSINALAQRLGDINPKISFGVADALAQLGGPNVVEAAAQKLANGDFNFIEKQRAIYVLGRIADKKSIAVLAGALKNEMMEYEAALALRQIGERAIPALAETVRASRYSDPNSITAAFAAARVLSTLGEPGYNALASIVHKSKGVDRSCQIAASYGWSYNGQKQLASLLKRNSQAVGGM